MIELQTPMRPVTSGSSVELPLLSNMQGEKTMNINGKYQKRIEEGTEKIFEALMNDVGEIPEDKVNDYVGLISEIGVLLGKNETIEHIASSKGVSEGTVLAVKAYCEELEEIGQEMKSYVMRSGRDWHIAM